MKFFRIKKKNYYKQIMIYLKHKKQLQPPKEGNIWSRRPVPAALILSSRAEDSMRKVWPPCLHMYWILFPGDRALRRIKCFTTGGKQRGACSDPQKITDPTGLRVNVKKIYNKNSQGSDFICQIQIRLNLPYQLFGPECDSQFIQKIKFSSET